MRASLWLAFFCTCGVLVAGPKEDAFEKSIRPLLIEKCYGCHSQAKGKTKGGLELDSQAGLLKGGDSGPAVVPGKPEESPIAKAIHRKDESFSAMPPDAPLSEAQIRDIERWIADGAVFPEAAKTTKADPAKHWAFQSVKKPAVPKVNDEGWPKIDIDRFVLAAMEAKGLKPSSEAEPLAVARRLAFAITGLPPTTAQMEMIERSGFDALDKLADELLASPHYGERWARHWMDLVRYADSCGQEYDYEVPGAWRYRDYLVRAFNVDLPFDCFAKEHIAGDLLPPRIAKGRNESLLATGWWQLQEQATAPVDLPNDEADRLDNQIDVLAKTFNGLTLGCARCHDHKFDPIRTKEYYGVFGIAAASPAHRTWANGPELDEQAVKLKKVRDGFDAKRVVGKPVEVSKLDLDKATVLGDFRHGLPDGWKVTGHAEAVTAETANLRGKLPGLWTGLLSNRLPVYIRSPQFTIAHEHIDVLVQGADSTIQVVVGNHQVIRDPIYNGLKQPIDKNDLRWVRFGVGRWKGRRAHVEVFTGKVDQHHRILHTNGTPKNRFGLFAALLNDGDERPIPAMPKIEPYDSGYAKAIAELEKAIPEPERIFAVQDVSGSDVPVHSRGDATKPKPDKEPRGYIRILQAEPMAVKSGSGRLELAEAIASPKNPLTARVYVNRIWHHLFGTGLVATVDNFGLLGEAPSHPELLDFLAERFVAVHKWSTKALIREIVLSRTYRQQTGPAPKLDPTNRRLSVFPLRRLDAEAIRDAILSTSGQLDPQLGGEPIPVPHALKDTGSDSGGNTPPSGPVDGHRRRSLYLASRRNFPSAFLDTFDKPASLVTFGRRDVSNVPTQALTLLNDPFVQEQAKAFGAKYAGAKLTDAERIRRMVRDALGRNPTEKEAERARALIAAEGGWGDFALVLFNLKEFITLP